MSFNFSFRKLQSSATEVAAGSEVATRLKAAVASEAGAVTTGPPHRPLRIAPPARISQGLQGPQERQRMPIAAAAATPTRRSPMELRIAPRVADEPALPAMSEPLASSLMNVPDLVMEGLSIDRRAERRAGLVGPPERQGPQGIRWNETAVRAAWAVRRDEVMAEVMPLVDQYLDTCPPDYRFTRIKNDCKALLYILDDPARGIRALPRRELLDVLSVVKGIRPQEVLDLLQADDQAAASATMRRHLEHAASRNVYDATMYLGMELLSPYD